MNENVNIRKLLTMMVMTERLGATLYEQLARKEREDPGLRDVYQTLSENEREMEDVIRSRPSFAMTAQEEQSSGLTVGILSFFFRVAPKGILEGLLKSALKRNMYRRLSETHNSHDPQLWEQLLAHERRQHELLDPFWNLPR